MEEWHYENFTSWFIINGRAKSCYNCIEDIATFADDSNEIMQKI